MIVVYGEILGDYVVLFGLLEIFRFFDFFLFVFDINSSEWVNFSLRKR